MVEKAAATHLYELKVGMTCGGCSAAVERIFGKSNEISKVTCDVAAQQVLVEGTDGLDLCAMLQKWSESAQKSVEFVSKSPL